MLLDNEKQRNFMLGLINAVPINGTYQQIRGTIASFDDLIVAVTNAHIAAPKCGAADGEKTGPVTLEKLQREEKDT